MSYTFNTPDMMTARFYLKQIEQTFAQQEFITLGQVCDILNVEDRSWVGHKMDAKWYNIQPCYIFAKRGNYFIFFQSNPWADGLLNYHQPGPLTMEVENEEDKEG